MKKSLLLLPLMVSLGLTACNSSSESEASVAEAGSSTTSAIPTWQSSETIQATDMPASMSSAPTHTIGQAPMTQNTPQATYGSVSQPVQQPQPVAVQPQAASVAQSETVGNCQVVRDSMGTPVYAQMVKGCYTDSSYTVGKSDTMYLISYLTGQTPAQIAALNNISTTTKLQVGQVLRVR
ncbi:LysM peptidoglycan-binding domain-containing protein [Actinobacillus suis]|uniref:Lipoprotein n=2 Tax=Actinobacillus suis TaxID=716 RepID=K0G6C7_ACTSU|nr:LysM domain-containing protein [Actinobacillus suis]AFU19643.1 lipoprotein [Actinobacillus suis H91-0380]AIJ31781.1 lipoprotein [Actinobacillus suis ATCC 33415]MCO4166279.1 LysM peptidoglycan-binding domain-containing protein [Actinobacillus suis]MCO4168868.1 LysM peptidoglycan-binding domain-containing protein [Actinobacillus suis]MCQ9629200.1 LysM peptidoglycan-binding domain-containing protein [Actinobacillus suis]